MEEMFTICIGLNGVPTPTPKMFVNLEPQNVTLFGNWIRWKDVIKLKRGHTKLVWALIQ